MPLTVQALDHLVVQVSDLEASAKWYARVLGMTREDVPPTDGKPPRTEMKFGRQKINLRPIADRARRIGSPPIMRPRAARTFAFSPIRSRTRSFAICRLKASRSWPAPARDGARRGR